MGIQNLLPNLKSIMDAKHIGAYAGKRVGIDALHRAAYTCAQELCLGQPSTKWLEWCLGRCQLLTHHQVIPVLVFDGGRLPEKDKTEHGRRESRDRSRARAMELLAGGDRAGAYKMFQKAIDITPAIARTLMNELRKRKIEFINAPYEADAQLAYLSLTGYIVSVITEDSDLLVFGCSRVFYKMDHTGNGCEIRLKNLGATTELSFTNWTHDMFQQMCIFAGCDYLESLPNVGIKKAHTFMSQHKSWDRALRRIRLDGKTKVPTTYDRDFELAWLTFKHQRVYDPVSRRLVHLTPVDQAFTDKFPDTAFLGADLPDDIASGIAEGLLDPDTRLPFATHTHSHAHTPAQATPISSLPTHSYSAAAVVPSFSAAMARRPRATAADRPIVSGWAKKHSTVDHHTQPAAAPLEYATRHQLTPHAAAAHSSHYTAAASLSLTQRKVIETCGALIDSPAAIVAAASVPAALKQDFRPPRKNESLRDVTNTSSYFSSTQPTPHRPAHKPADASRHAERGRLLDQCVSTGYAGRSSSGGHAEESSWYPMDSSEAGPDDGFSHEDAAAELAMEEEDDEDVTEVTGHRVSLPPRKPKMNFLSRSGHGVVLPPRPQPAAAYTSPPIAVRPRTKLAPPSAVPLPFFSPPDLQSPSPPPAAASGPSNTFSKYFVSGRPRAYTSRPPPPAAAVVLSDLMPPPSRVPDAAAFLFAPPSVPTPACVYDDEDEGRIDMEVIDVDDEEEAPGAASTRRRGGVKRAASSSSAASDLKRFRSPLVNPKGRLTLQVSSSSVGPTTPPSSSALFHPVRSSTCVRMEDSPSPSQTPSPDPITSALARTHQAPQPFRQLTVQPRSPRSSSSHLAPPIRPRYYDVVDLSCSSQPEDAYMPPSPTPSPDVYPSASPSSTSVSPSCASPPVSQAFAGPYAAAGFSSQPSEADEDDEYDQLPLPAVSDETGFRAVLLTV